ncbi:MAG: PQQ-dependent sugar dehydrogenase [Chthoniobacterales bacterium]
MRWTPLLSLFALFAFAKSGTAALRAVPVADGFDSPIFATAPAGDSRLFVAEQGGTIRILDSATGTVRGTPFLTVTNIVSSGEQGQLGLAFHPNYASNGYFYVNVTRASDGATEIRRYHATGANTADASSGTVILTYAQPFSNHNGGWLAFGPDGFLYIAAGDGGDGNDPGNRAQNTNVLLGKILRIDVDNPAGGRAYGIPAGNPFATGGGAPEVWDYGLRNPWRDSFDRVTGDLWIGDVGQSAREEIDFHRAGAAGGINYGWRVFEGSIRTPGISDTAPSNAVGPVYDYTHAVGQAIIGGYVCHGMGGELDGLYIFGDEVSGRVWTFRPVNGVVTDLRERTAEVTSNGGIESLSSFAEDAGGSVYAISLAGTIYRIVGDASPRPKLKVSGPRKRTTSLPSIRLRGSASDDGRVRRITYDVSGTKKHGSIRGKSRWHLLVPLHEGRNRIVLRAVDDVGGKSQPVVIVVTRR